MKHVFIINPTAGKADSRQKIYDMADALRTKHDLDVQCILTKKQGHAAVDVDGVHGELRPVPQVLRVPELLQIVAEVLEEVVAGAHGDGGHGGVVVADDAVGHLVDGAVAAAGVEP